MAYVGPGPYKFYGEDGQLFSEGQYIDSQEYYDFWIGKFTDTPEGPIAYIVPFDDPPPIVPPPGDSGSGGSGGSGSGGSGSGGSGSGGSGSGGSGSGGSGFGGASGSGTDGGSGGSGSGGSGSGGSGTGSGSGNGSGSGSDGGSGSGNGSGSGSGTGSGSGSGNGSGSGSGCPACYVPPPPEIDEETLNSSGVDVLAPNDVPENITLILQVRPEEGSFSDYAEGIGAGERVRVDVESCTWFALRWKTQSEDQGDS